MTGKNTFIALLICIIAIPGCKRASRLDSTLEECERLAAQNPDSVMRVLDELQRTTASMDEHDQKRFLLTKLAVQNATDRPFMELDTRVSNLLYSFLSRKYVSAFHHRVWF